MGKNHKIIFFLAHLDSGGAERMMVNLANAMFAKGYMVEIVLVQKRGPLISKVNNSIKIVDLGCRRMLTAMPAVVRYLRNEKPERLISTLSYTDITILMARKLAKTRTKIVVRLAVALSKSFVQKLTNIRITKRLAPFIYPWADEFIAVAKGVEEDFRKVIPVQKSRKIHVIYNPVINDALYTQAAQPVDHPWLQNKKHTVILCVGRLWKQKDFPTMIRAMQQIAQKNKNARLLILGEGPERKNLEQLISQLNLEDYVAMPGYVSNPYAYMSKADIFVLCSLYEGLPNALIEAMACGCHLVSTDCESGPAEILDFGKYGYLIPVGDSLALAQAVEETIHGKTKQIEKSWLEQFSVDHVTDKYLEVLGISP